MAVAVKTPAQAKDPTKEEVIHWARELIRVKRDSLYFLEEYVWTIDEDAEDPTEAFKRFPSRAKRPDLYALADRWNKERVMLVEKSRQMMITWLFIALYLHRACFFPGRRIFFQSKKETDAKALKDRASFIYRRLPPWMKVAYDDLDVTLTFPTLESEIWAIPQGADHIRSYTSSGILDDEAPFQPEFPDAYAASLPSIGKNGKLTVVGSPNGKNFFYRLAKDIKGNLR